MENCDHDKICKIKNTARGKTTGVNLISNLRCAIITSSQIKSIKTMRSSRNVFIKGRLTPMFFKGKSNGRKNAVAHINIYSHRLKTAQNPILKTISSFLEGQPQAL